MGKKAQADRKRADRMGLRQVGLTKRDADALNDVAHGEYGVGIGVIVQELEKHEQLAASLEREPVAWWNVERRWARSRERKRELELAGMWGERLRRVSRIVADRMPTAELAERLRAR